MKGDPRRRFTKAGKKAVMERVYKNRKLSRERGLEWDGGFHTGWGKRGWEKDKP